MDRDDRPTITDMGRLDQADMAQDAEEAPRSTSGPDRPDEGLLPEETGATFRDRWQEIQVRFVDEPRDAVRDADGLVEELMQQLAGSFTEQRRRLEEEWTNGSDASTEDLRRAFQHYRSFFSRLLAA